MGIYSKVVGAASVGATADTFDNIGIVTLRGDAKRVLGIWYAGAPATETAAETISGQLRVSSDDLGIGQNIASVGPYTGANPATNVGYACYNAEFVPLFVDEPDKCKKAAITLDFSSNLPDPTGACSVVCGVVYEAGDGDQGLPGTRALFPWMAAVAKGYRTEASAGTPTTAELALTDLNIPAWAKEIVGFKQFCLPKTFAAGEELVGYMRYRSTFKDWEPQEWPLVFAVGAPLGTAVGRGATGYAPDVFGTNFKLEGVAGTITPNCILNVASTNAASVVSTVYFR